MSTVVPNNFERMYQPPEWFDIEQTEKELYYSLELNDPLMRRIAGTLGVAERLGSIPDDTSKIFEFGSGMGEGLVVLDMLAKSRDDAEVIGSEILPYKHRVASKVASVLETARGVEQDGLAALEALEAESIDVVLANMFGPSYMDKSLPEQFIRRALGALRSGGSVVINSDALTMNSVSQWAEDNLGGSRVIFIEDDLLPPEIRARWPHMIITK